MDPDGWCGGDTGALPRTNFFQTSTKVVTSKKPLKLHSTTGTPSFGKLLAQFFCKCSRLFELFFLFVVRAKPLAVLSFT